MRHIFLPRNSCENIYEEIELQNELITYGSSGVHRNGRSTVQMVIFTHKVGGN